MFEIDKMEQDFDYSLVDNETADFLRSCEYEMNGIAEDARVKFGRVLKRVQEKLSNHHDGIFVKWYESGGMNKHDVYYAINVYEISTNLENSKKENFLNAPKTLQKEVMKKNAPEELKEQVFSGDITTNKQYKNLLEAKQQAEKQAEQARQSEEIALKQLEELESKEPETIEKEVIPEHVKTKLFESDKKILETTEELRDTKMKLERLKNQVSYDSESDKKEKELKALQYNADKTVLTTKLRMDEFLKDVAVTSFRKGAIASSSEATQDNLKQGVEELEDFCKEMRIALSGRIDLSKQGVN